MEQLEALQEVEFLLLYYVNGMTPDRVWRMDHEERMWWLKRLVKQKKTESKKPQTER